MLVMLGDTITIMKGETWVTGQVAGVVLDDTKELERIYFHHINVPFWMRDGWKVVDESEDEEQEDEI